MKFFIKSIVSMVMVLFLTCSASFAQGTYSGQAVKHSVAASTNASKAAGNAIAGSAQVVSGVAAVPLIVVGSVVQKTGEGLWDAATQPVDGPLEISDETVSAGPSPEAAMAQDDL